VSTGSILSWLLGYLVVVELSETDCEVLEVMWKHRMLLGAAVEIFGGLALTTLRPKRNGVGV
jgi:hypothetical protein